MRLPGKKRHCHSHAVGHDVRCDKTTLQKKGTITHLLLVVGLDMITLPGPREIGQCHSQAVDM